MPIQKTKVPVAKAVTIRTSESPSSVSSSSTDDVLSRVIQLSSLFLERAQENNYPFTFEEMFYSPFDICTFVMRCLPQYAGVSMSSYLWRSFFMDSIRGRLLQAPLRTQEFLADLLGWLVLDCEAHMEQVQSQFNFQHHFLAQQADEDSEGEDDFILKNYPLAQMK